MISQHIINWAIFPYVIRRCEEDREYYYEKCDDNEDEGQDRDDHGVSAAMAYIYNPEERIGLLCIHGMFHLVGYDHIEEKDMN